MELRRGTFYVLLDGRDGGSIDMHSAIKVPITPGHHTLQVKDGRSTSSGRSFDSADVAIVNCYCHSSRIWPIAPGLLWVFYVSGVRCRSTAHAFAEESVFEERDRRSSSRYERRPVRPRRPGAVRLVGGGRRRETLRSGRRRPSSGRDIGSTPASRPDATPEDH